MIKFDPKQLIFMKSKKKLIVSKPMKHNKNVDTLSFLLLFTKGQLENNIEKIFFVSPGVQKRLRATGSRNTLPQYLPNPKNKFPVKYIFT